LLSDLQRDEPEEEPEVLNIHSPIGERRVIVRYGLLGSMLNSPRTALPYLSAKKELESGSNREAGTLFGA
jgi:hypothetical protein